MLERDEVSAELISDRDAIHVHEQLQKIVLKCKGIEKIIIVTDSMRETGLRDGHYETADGREYVVDSRKSDVIWMIEGKVLYGSICKLKDNVRHFARNTGIDTKQAIQTVTINPARLLGMDDTIGSLSPGKRANLVVFDADFNIQVTMLDGCVVYRRKEAEDNGTK
jgi:N-acetylglucosamine-6-phosphate deacetylase